MKQEGPEFISYKKLVIFGCERVGKSTFVSKMEGNAFSEEYIPTDQGNKMSYNCYYRYQKL